MKNTRNILCFRDYQKNTISYGNRPWLASITHKSLSSDPNLKLLLRCCIHAYVMPHALEQSFNGYWHRLFLLIKCYIWRTIWGLRKMRLSHVLTWIWSLKVVHLGGLGELLTGGPPASASQNTNSLLGDIFGMGGSAHTGYVPAKQVTFPFYAPCMWESPDLEGVADCPERQRAWNIRHLESAKQRDHNGDDVQQQSHAGNAGFRDPAEQEQLWHDIQPAVEHSFAQCWANSWCRTTNDLYWACTENGPPDEYSGERSTIESSSLTCF